MQSQKKVARLIDAAEVPFHRILLMTLYATGARRVEVAHLKISDIDSRRMVIHIQQGGTPVRRHKSGGFGLGRELSPQQTGIADRAAWAYAAS